MKLYFYLLQRVATKKKLLPNTFRFTEERANWISHALGIVFGILAGGWILMQAINTNFSCFTATLVYILSFILLYSASTIYHLFSAHPNHELFHKFDHISIYFLIAGSYTPFLVCSMDNFTGRLYLALIWGLVGLGIIYKLTLMGRYRWLSLSLYLLMGWMIVFNFPAFWQNLPLGSLVWIIIGGLFYSVGVIFYVWRKIRFSHLIWHLFVLAGSISHFIAVYVCIANVPE